jgi:hypothetical protein
VTAVECWYGTAPIVQAETHSSRIVQAEGELSGLACFGYDCASKTSHVRANQKGAPLPVAVSFHPKRQRSTFNLAVVWRCLSDFETKSHCVVCSVFNLRVDLLVGFVVLRWDRNFHLGYSSGGQDQQKHASKPGNSNHRLSINHVSGNATYRELMEKGDEYPQIEAKLFRYFFKLYFWAWTRIRERKESSCTVSAKHLFGIMLQKLPVTNSRKKSAVSLIRV